MFSVSTVTITQSALEATTLFQIKGTLERAIHLKKLLLAITKKHASVAMRQPLLQATFRRLNWLVHALPDMMVGCAKPVKITITRNPG
jgi:hypothetical protein